MMGYCPNCDAVLRRTTEWLVYDHCNMSWDWSYFRLLPTRPIGPVERETAFAKAWKASSDG
jgi:hypothetical protein